MSRYNRSASKHGPESAKEYQSLSRKYRVSNECTKVYSGQKTVRFSVSAWQPNHCLVELFKYAVHPSATTLKLLTWIPLIIPLHSKGKPWVLIFMWMPFDSHHPQTVFWPGTFPSWQQHSRWHRAPKLTNSAHEWPLANSPNWASVGTEHVWSMETRPWIGLGSVEAWPQDIWERLSGEMVTAIGECHCHRLVCIVSNGAWQVASP